MPKVHHDSKEQSKPVATGSAFSSLSAPTPSTQDLIKELVIKAGGIFIGKNELINLGQASEKTIVPELSSKYDQSFFEAKHPLRDGIIASHIILAFDQKSNEWQCFEKSIVPDSINLSAEEQDKLLRIDGKNISAGENQLIAAPDFNIALRVLNLAIASHLHNPSLEETIEKPFERRWARTADLNGSKEHRVLLGYSLGSNSARFHQHFRNKHASHLVGLLACWK